MRDSAIMYRNFMKAVRKLPVEKQGAAYEAYMLYAMDGEEYSGDDYAIAALLESFRDQIDEDSDKYKAKCARAKKINSERNSTDIDTKSDRNRNKVASDNDIDIVSKETTPNGVAKKAASRFTPPTVEEIAAYCRERGNHVDPQRFYDFYASKGWRVGNQSMKDWKAAVRTWEQRDRQPDPPASYGKPQQGMQREEDLDAMLLDRVMRRPYGELDSVQDQGRGGPDPGMFAAQYTGLGCP